MLKKILSFTLATTVACTLISPLGGKVQAINNNQQPTNKKYLQTDKWKDGDLEITLLKNNDSDAKAVVVNTKTGITIEGETRKDTNGISIDFTKKGKNVKTETYTIPNINSKSNSTLSKNAKGIASTNPVATGLGENKNIPNVNSKLTSPLTKSIGGGISTNAVIVDDGGSGGTWDMIHYVFPSYSNNVDYMHPNKAYYGFGKNVSQKLVGYNKTHFQYSYESTYRILGTGTGVSMVLIGTITGGLLGSFPAALVGAFAGYFCGTEIVEQLKDEDGCLWLVYTTNPTVLSQSYNGKLGKYIYQIQYPYCRFGPFEYYNVTSYTS